MTWNLGISVYKLDTNFGVCCDADFCIVANWKCNDCILKEFYGIVQYSKKDKTKIYHCLLLGKENAY